MCAQGIKALKKTTDACYAVLKRIEATVLSGFRVLWSAHARRCNGPIRRNGGPRPILEVTLMMRAIGLTCVVLACGPVFADEGPLGPEPPGLAVTGAEPFPAMNALFDRTEGWIGADGVHSLPLGDGETLWLFSDTWVGAVRDGKRQDATIVNNTAAIQRGRAEDATVRFVVCGEDVNEPRALITPADGKGWFWLQAGAMVNGGLAVFLSQIEKTADPGVFGFRQVGQWLGTIGNPQDDPLSWRVEQKRLPHGIYTDTRILSFGAALLRRGDMLYIYGTDEDIHPTARDRYLIAARVPVARVAEFTAWEFLHAGTWQPDFWKSSRLVPNMASDCSVGYLAERRQYVLVYTEGGLSERILIRTAPEPRGPWSEAVVAYHCPEARWDPRIFCYNARAHPVFSSGDTLVVSYVANSFDFWHVATDARLYWPRFIRVHLGFEE